MADKKQALPEIYVSPETAAYYRKQGKKIPFEANIRPFNPAEDKNVVLICGDWDGISPLKFADNLTGDCTYGCGRKIQWRPHNNQPSTKVCPSCGIARVEAEYLGEVQ